MKCPEGWYEIDGSSLGAAFMFAEPQEDTPNANINLVIEDLSENKMSLEAYTESTVRYLICNLKDFNLIENATCSLGQYDASKIVFLGKFVNDGIEYTLQWLQVMTIFEDKAFVVTFTSYPSQYGNYLDIIEETLASFEIS
jgi:serine/threonine-protein kinase